MIRTCPKCGEYYADALLAFCLVDGTPLVDVDLHSESWSAGARVIEAKEQALRKQKSRLKWRRVLTSVMTMLIATMVVCVVAVNSYIYLKPKPEEIVLVKPTPPAPSPDESINSVKPDEPVPTPSPRPTITLKPSPTPTPTPTPTCSKADESRERESIIRKYGDIWGQVIQGDRSTIIAGKAPDGAKNAEAWLAGALKFESAFSKACTESLVTVRYTWNVSYQEINVATQTRTPKVVTVAQNKRFRCVKSSGAWHCR